MVEHDPIILISANSEWKAICTLLEPGRIHSSPLGDYFVLNDLIYFHGGWGKVAAAASTQYVLDRFHPALVINLGTCGGIAGRVERGAIILATRTIIYDILEQMSDPRAAIDHYATDLNLSWLPDPPPHPVQPGVLFSADRDIRPEDISTLVETFGAVAADWESGAIAWVANRNSVPCLILRGVSDLVSPAGGEAYGNINLFHLNTLTIMQELVHQLPGWLAAVPAR